jgi:DNA processing protein
LVIVSGLARGIDTAAHRGALRTQTGTVAVFGSGVDVVYPPENQALAESILSSGGALISEFPLGAFPAPQNFPIRNRIISGMSLGSVVVEASEYSGSLITARMALEQDREVFAVPGNITSRTSVGPNYLIQQGAKLVQTWRDVIEELPLDVRSAVLQEPQQKPALDLPLLEEQEAEVLQRLRGDVATHIDDLNITCGEETGRLQELLLDLELKGYIRQLPGKTFIRLCS